MRLDRAGPAAFVHMPLFDVADDPRQNAPTAVANHELRHRVQLRVGYVGCRRERHAQSGRGSVGVEPGTFRQRFVGQREQELLTIRELHQVHVDRAVREDARRHVEAERAVDLAARISPPIESPTSCVTNATSRSPRSLAQASTMSACPNSEYARSGFADSP